MTGTWRVPYVVGSESEGKRASSFWVGLDGDGVDDLMQAGTQQDVVTSRFSGASAYGDSGLTISLSSYAAWTEFVPQQQTEQVIPGFWVEPGDEIFTQVWIGDAGETPSLTGLLGVTFMQNNRTGVYTWVYTERGDTQVGGSEAEWIMERPTIEPPVFVPPYGLYPLADYDSAIMSNAFARRANAPRGQGYTSYLGAQNRQITMFGLDGATLSTVRALDASTMKFQYGALRYYGGPVSSFSNVPPFLP